MKYLDMRKVWVKELELNRIVSSLFIPQNNSSVYNYERNIRAICYDVTCYSKDRTYKVNIEIKKFNVQ